ncbi:MAG: chaperone NapD [Allomuricauda sp.]
MPIKSYLVHPHDGKKEELLQELSAMSSCEVVAAQNREIIALVTETETKQEEEALKTRLESIKSLKLLALVSGFNTPQ